MANMIEVITNMPLKNKIILVGVIALVIASSVMFFSWVQKADMQILYSNLSEEDTGAIIQKLNEQKVPYKASAGGIMVPADKVYELRLQLAGQGLPQGGGVGFEIFDKSGFTMTDFVQKLNYRRALQGELARTIRSLPEVEQSRVHLVVPERSLFVKEEERPKASVLVKLKAGRRLSQGQVQGIVHLVSGSVEGLALKDVAVVDSRGEMLTVSVDDSAAMSAGQMEHQRNIEKDMENRIISILDPVVGKGRVRAKVAAVVDFTKVEKTEERFDPESQVVRSEQKNTEKSTSGSGGGIPGVQSNLPGKAPQQTASSQGQSDRKSETINYEISKVTSHTVNSPGDIKKLSAVVLVDGIYTAQEGSKEKKYAARTEEELKNFEDMAKKAIGFTAERSDEVRVVNMPFEAVSQEELPEAPKEIMPVVMTVAKYLVPLIAFALLFIFVIKPLMTALTSSSGMMQTQIALPGTVSEIERAIEASALPDKEKVVEWAKKNPADAANLVKSWIEEK
jgi:flagellar M-ring protein FliF